MGNPSPFGWAVIVIVAVFHLAGVASAVDFLFNSFIDGSNQLQLIYVDRPVIRLTHDNTQSSSVGRAFYPAPIPMRRQTPPGGTTIASYSSSFVFSIMHEILNLSGLGMVFVISNSTDPPGSLPGQYFGLFANSTVPTAALLLAVEFDTGRNPESGDSDRNHQQPQLRRGHLLALWVISSQPHVRAAVHVEWLQYPCVDRLRRRYSADQRHHRLGVGRTAEAAAGLLRQSVHPRLQIRR